MGPFYAELLAAREVIGLIEGFPLDVLQHIQESWDILTKDDCVPVHIALQLMDFSSLGRGNDYHDFQQTRKQLQKALKAIVNGTPAVYRAHCRFAESS